MTKRDSCSGRGKPPADYEVGYGKPPKGTQFKKGQSGNPNGRRPAKTIETRTREFTKRALEEVVAEKDGRSLSAIEAAFLSVRNNVLRDGKSLDLERLLALAERYKVLSPSAEQSDGTPTYGVLVVPLASTSIEEWERVHGDAARGKPPPPWFLEQVSKTKPKEEGE